jgi:hypothetical protein
MMGLLDVEISIYPLEESDVVLFAAKYINRKYGESAT